MPRPRATRTLLAIATSAYSSYSSCRQYREDFARVLDATALGGHRHDRQGAPVLRPPRLRRTPFTEGVTACRPRADRRRRRGRAHPRAVLDPQHPDRRCAALRSPRPRLRPRWRVRRAARGGRRIRDGERRRGDARSGGDRVGARLPVPLRSADAAVARAGRLRRDRRAARARRRGRRHRAARLRQRPHGSAVGPRHRGDGGRARRPASGRSARRRPASIPRS